jgi:hypothetical protein
MRTLVIAVLVAAPLAACTDTAFDENVTYRRLNDQFESHDQCLAEGDFTPCYQTLHMCTDGRAVIDLQNSPQHGTYQLADSEAVLTFTVMGTIHFDLDAESSAQLPGVHPWEHIDPTFQSCD